MSVDVDFNKHSEFVWVYTVFLFSHTCFSMCLKHTEVQGLSFKKKENIAGRFISISICTDDVLALNDSKFVDYVDRIYPIELEIKETTQV